jgi:hypothetical protein
MKINSLFLFFCLQIGFSQEIITRNLGDFDTVKTFDQITLQLIPSNENKIELTGKNANEVEIITINNELKIRMPLKKLLKGDEIIGYLYYKKINAIEASEGTSISSEKPINQIAIEISTKEGARINLNLAVKKATISATSGSKIEVQGTTENVDVNANSGATITANNLKSTQTSVVVNSGASAKIYATELVEAKATTGGVITIFGEPKQVNKKKSLGGAIYESR